MRLINLINKSNKSNKSNKVSDTSLVPISNTVVVTESESIKVDNNSIKPNKANKNDASHEGMVLANKKFINNLYELNYSFMIFRNKVNTKIIDELDKLLGLSSYQFSCTYCRFIKDDEDYLVLISYGKYLSNSSMILMTVDSDNYGFVVRNCSSNTENLILSVPREELSNQLKDYFDSIFAEMKNA